MPVRKSSLRPMMDEPMLREQASEPVKSSMDCSTCDPHTSCVKHTRWAGWMGRKLLVTFIGILIVYLVVLVGALIRNEIRKYDYIGRADKIERTVRVEGEGKVSVKPNIAVVVMGATTEGKTVAEAQSKNTEIVNKLISRLKELGIADPDMQTQDYTVYPLYDYSTDGKSTIRGYNVSQNVSVKIRDLTKANQVLGLAGEVGATNVSGPEFTIDDREVYLEQARAEALKKVHQKANALSSMLGLRLVSIFSYEEYEGQSGNYPFKSYDMTGLGGAPAPQIEAGTNEVVMNVVVTFELE